MRNGFILLHRQGLTQDEWKHPLRTLAWVDLLTLAAWEDYTTDDGTFLRRGEMVASETFLAKRWRQNRGTVHRWLLHWEAEGMIRREVKPASEQESQRLFVVNYAKFQDVPKHPNLTEKSAAASAAGVAAGTAAATAAEDSASGSQEEDTPQRPSQRVPQQGTQRLPQIMKRREENQKKQNEKKETGSALKGVSDGPTINKGERERRFKEFAIQHGWDEPYAEKTWDQGMSMSARSEFERKVSLLLGWSRIPLKLPKAKLLLHEIAGFVNDRGAMQNKLTPEEIEARRLFREETGQNLEPA